MEKVLLNSMGLFGKKKVTAPIVEYDPEKAESRINVFYMQWGAGCRV